MRKDPVYFLSSFFFQVHHFSVATAEPTSCFYFPHTDRNDADGENPGASRHVQQTAESKSLSSRGWSAVSAAAGTEGNSFCLPSKSSFLPRSRPCQGCWLFLCLPVPAPTSADTLKDTQMLLKYRGTSASRFPCLPAKQERLFSRRFRAA